MDDAGLSRRDLLRAGAGATAAGLAGPALAPVLGEAARRARGDHRIGFRTLAREVRLARLPVEGRLPDWLRGTLVRNGPAQFEVGSERFNHWFDGLAMLHAFSFTRGRVGYANRFLRSSQYEASRREGRIRYSEFATDPCRAIFNGAAAMFVPAPVPNANVHVEALGRRFVAHTEIPLPVRFDPVTLRTLGVGGAQAPFATLGTAHPHHDPRTGERFAYRVRLMPPSGYEVVVSRGGRERLLATIPAAQPAYMHSFALTRRYVVLAEFPYRLDPLKAVTDWKPVIRNYEWRGGDPARFHVVDRRSGATRSFETASFFAFHHINAFEQGDRLVLDLCASADPSIVHDLFLDELRRARRGPVPSTRPRRYELDLRAGTVRRRALAAVELELPRVHYDRVNGRDYRFAYGTSLRDRRTSAFIDQLAKVDVRSGRTRRWREAGAYPGEPVFVPAPGARAEDDGVVLSVVLDARRARSFLLVLDARSFTERARARVPHHIPFGFHGRLFA